MKLTLSEKRQETPDVTTFVFEPEQPITWEAGQYLHYTLPHENPDDRGIERWFTVSSAPSKKYPQITTRHSEKGSTFKTALFNLSVSDTIEADGPEGDFTLPDSVIDFVFIAGGIGITPFHSILSELDAQGASINGLLLYANRDDQFVFGDELDAIAHRNDGLAIQYVSGDARIDETMIRQCVADLSEPVFYVSGPEPMVAAFVPMLKAMGIPESHIKQDDFPGYEWKP